MLPKIVVGVCMLAVLSSGCGQALPTSTIVAQQSPPTTTSTPRPTITKTPTSRPTLKPVNDLTRQAEFREGFYTLTPTHTPPPTPTQTPTPTPEPVPPLIAHEWTSDPILIRFGQVGGDGADPLDFSLPSLILYSDGTLIYRKWKVASGDDVQVELWQVDLDRQQMCALLNAIDQTGFFDYDPSTYLPKGQYLPFDGASNTVIEVNAWRSKRISLNGLWVFLNDEPSAAGAIAFGDPNYGTIPYIPTALRNTYELLVQFKPGNAMLYHPNRLAIRIGYSSGYHHGELWPLTSLQLIDLYNRSNSGDNLVIVKGNESAVIYRVFENTMDARIFEDATHTFVVAVRPLLPYERPSFDYAYNPIDTPSGFEKPMKCDPNDGLLHIP